MKLKSCIHVHGISLYENIVFYCCCSSTLVAVATSNFHRLIMGKVEIGIYFCVTADTLTKVLQKCSWSSLLQTTSILSKSLILIGCHGNRNVNFRKKYSKIFFSEVIRGKKLKPCINVYGISLYENIVFYCCCSSTLVAVATSNFHRLIMGKVEIGIYFCVTADTLTKVLQKCSWGSPLQTT